ncbi:LOW QUALITY PROTEIN: protein monoglycylase TTLL8-like, partial [Myotis lucifugus]|uniref:LOW QUALITY PROTEIN: protein monoglycylase TTLL8-like n=1 Tax=Myotis lucifugus TaxID=59463 RepID=UPI000CCBE60B
MEPGERKRLLSASSSEGDWREENKLKRGDSSASPKLDRYKMARQLTEKAIKDKKIFSIHGHYPVVRALLRRKGWVEKKLHFLPRISVSADGDGEGAAGRYRSPGPSVCIGLCLNMRSLPWYAQANPDAFFPRCYGLGSDSEKQEFLAPENDSKLVGLSGQLVDLACQVCQAYLGQLEHEDIDVAKDAATDLTEEQWKELTQQYYALIHGKAFISNPRNHFSQCQALLNRISSASPQTEIDGLRNIWIVKPAAKSRGRDIVCMNRVEEILELVASDNLLAKDKWVVQKYIETPLLIYDTKFDIRQWFLVTDWNPLTIWFYKESYLRFSTRRFSLDDLDGAIHLCNNSIQKHLKIDKGRSPLLPYHNMWTSARFQEYLQKRGRGSVWGSVIYPAMKQAIANTMKVAQDHVEPRKSSFELYGADFILGHDFKPWLIEINSSPTMHASTPVTAQLCAQVQEDTIKVVLDRKGDRNCDVGNFELLWKQSAVDLPPVYGSDLCVKGVSLRKGKKQMPPIPHFRFSPLAPGPRSPLKAAGAPRAMPDLAARAPGPSRQHLEAEIRKG